MDMRTAAGKIHDSEEAHAARIEGVARFLLARRGKVRLVLIGGPSSAGKTTFAKRLQHHLERDGASTLAISTDDYFVGDELNPRDSQGRLDYEHIRAMDLELLNDNLVDLIAGRTAMLPKFDFHRHAPMEERTPAQLSSGDSFIIIEGLHSLNPELTPHVGAECKFLVLADTVSSPFPSGAEEADQRLVRRIIRDSKYRGRSAEDTILLWDSVRAGERRWIRPFVGNAEYTFDTTLPYEPGVLKNFIEPELRKIGPGSPAAPAARRLMALFGGVEPIDPALPPPYSILREYIGDSIIQY